MHAFLPHIPPQSRACILYTAYISIGIVKHTRSMRKEQRTPVQSMRETFLEESVFGRCSSFFFLVPPNNICTYRLPCHVRPYVFRRTLASNNIIQFTSRAHRQVTCVMRQEYHFFMCFVVVAPFNVVFFEACAFAFKILITGKQQQQHSWWWLDRHQTHIRILCGLFFATSNTLNDSH